MRIEKQQVTAKSVSAGDWIEFDLGVAHQVLEVKDYIGRIEFLLVGNKRYAYDANEIVDLLIAA